MMRNFLIYVGVFVVAAVLIQLFVLDSVRLSIFFSPLAYIAFIVLLPMSARPVAVLLLGFATGVFMDFFEGTGGLHTAATLFTAYTRRRVMILMLGRESVEQEGVMPSVKSLGTGKFLRYAGAVVAIHCLLYFTLEALSWKNYHLVLLKTAVSGTFTLLAVWAVSLLFTIRMQKKA
uniref:Putative rod shape-determining protein MreD n=1 Tax=termite gut metagenome TaxID=433724 RepID=S0DF06_9ZZZZ